jgi:S-adenosylmethionine:tRNA ribosyltransferase-isomerase
MTSPFLDYDLPERLIAQEPCPERDGSRLLVVRRAEGLLEHRLFRDLPELLAPGDLLVLNDTRVLPARLIGWRAETGGKWEGLFLRTSEDGLWEILCQTRGRLRDGETICLDSGPLQLTLERRSTAGRWLARPDPSGPAAELLGRFGHVPLPPYIRKGRSTPADRDRYQTVYARKAGAVAAPTAGLHFTPDLFERLGARGIECTFITLHIGLGTFRPLEAVNPENHKMHSEWGELNQAAVSAIERCRKCGGRVVAVGTTCVRLLETVAATGELRPWSGETELYIHPPFRFRLVNALITNFHLPRSTLLLLVGAFAGWELIRPAYEAAIDREYRFYSYGDAMLIL